MKRKNLFTVCFCAVCLFYGCDVFTFAEITFENDSSRDLNVSVDYVSDECNEFSAFELKINQSTMVSISKPGRSNYPKINEHIKNIIFSNVETGETIKTLNSNFESKMVFVSKHDGRRKYLFTITDDLLE